MERDKMAIFDLSNLFAILILFAGVATLQFFYGRKLNLLLMKNAVDELEKTIKPKDQLYTWLGGYVGFRAEYRIDDPDVERVEVTLTLLPRQSILYLPVSKLTLGGDRMFFVLRCRHAVKGDVHVVKSGTYRFTSPINGEIEYVRENIQINGINFIAYYRRKSDLERLVKLLEGMPLEGLKHLSVTPSTRVIYAFITPEKGIVEKVYPKMLNVAREFTGF